MQHPSGPCCSRSSNIYQRLLLRLLVDPRRAPMMPLVTTPATVRVSGDFRTCSNVDGAAFGARPPGAAGALVAPPPLGAGCAEAALAASISLALSRSMSVAYFLTCGDVATRC